MYASFNILVDFIEKEKAFERVNWDSDIHHKYARNTMKVLYKWWKAVRPAKLKRIEEALFDSGDHTRWDVLEEELHKEEERALQKLAKVRLYMWT